MLKLKVKKTGVNPDTGEPVYRLMIGGRTVREDLTLEQVIEAINRQDEEGLAEGCGPLSPADAGQLPLQGRQRGG